MFRTVLDGDFCRSYRDAEEVLQPCQNQILWRGFLLVGYPRSEYHHEVYFFFAYMQELWRFDMSPFRYLILSFVKLTIGLGSHLKLFTSVNLINFLLQRILLTATSGWYIKFCNCISWEIHKMQHGKEASDF